MPGMDLGALVVTFAAVFVVELPDKTFLAALVLTTRYRPFLVWIGVGAAFVVQSAVAVALGGVASLLPKDAVHAVSIAFFTIGAILLVREGRHHRGDTGEGYVEKATPAAGFRAVLASFLVIFAAEWGDLSQLLTISLTARYQAPLSVFVGAVLALLAVSGVAVVAGGSLTRWVPVHVLTYVGAGVCAVLAGLTAYDLVS